MAGKRMQLKMDMKLFSHVPVYKATIHSWLNAVENYDDMKEKLAHAILMCTTKPFKLEIFDSKIISYLFQTVQDAVPGAQLECRFLARENFSINDIPDNALTQYTVMDAAGDSISDGLWFMMLIGTWRLFVQKMEGPLPGIGINISLAGAVATLMRLQVSVDMR